MEKLKRSHETPAFSAAHTKRLFIYIHEPHPRFAQVLLSATHLSLRSEAFTHSALDVPWVLKTEASGLLPLFPCLLYHPQLCLGLLKQRMQWNISTGKKRKDKLHQDLPVFNFAETYFVSAPQRFLLSVRNGTGNKYSLLGKRYHIIKPKLADAADFQVSI